MGRRRWSSTCSACSPSASSSARAGGRSWPAIGSASSRSTWPTSDPRCASPPRLPALLAGGGVDTALDPVALHHYLSFHSVVPAPRTILAGVRKLPPATTLTVEPDGTRHEHRYWRADFSRDPDRADWTAEDWTEAVRESLRTAVRRRMVSDVPVGVLLSGGLDSSLIVALLAESDQHGLATFSVGFGDVGDREGNEFAYSALVAERFGTAPHEHRDRRGAPGRGARRGDRRDERADGLPRLRRVLPAVGGGRRASQGRPVRAGRRRGLRRLLLVRAPRRPGVGSRHLSRHLRRPRPCGDGGGADRPARRGLLARLRRGAVRGRSDPRRRRAAHRHRGDARRRPRQARRQHDDGPRPRGAHAVPRPRARRARRARARRSSSSPKAARACSRRPRAASSPTR